MANTKKTDDFDDIFNNSTDVDSDSTLTTSSNKDEQSEVKSKVATVWYLRPLNWPMWKKVIAGLCLAIAFIVIWQVYIAPPTRTHRPKLLLDVQLNSPAPDTKPVDTDETLIEAQTNQLESAKNAIKARDDKYLQLKKANRELTEQVSTLTEENNSLVKRLSVNSTETAADVINYPNNKLNGYSVTRAYKGVAYIRHNRFIYAVMVGDTLIKTKILSIDEKTRTVYTSKGVIK